MNSIVRLTRDCTGASAAEYALVLAIVGSALAVAALTLGSTIANSMNYTGETVRTCGGAC